MLIAIGVYVLAQLAIAAWASRGIASETDYLVAGRRLGVWPVALSLFATWFASETVIATSAEVAENGLAGARVEPFGYGLGIVVLGLFVAGALRRGGHLSIAGFFGARFGPAAEGLAAAAVALSGLIWAAAQLYALATILAASSGLGFAPALAVSTAVVLAYTLLGGLIGDVVTDMVQGVVLVIGLVVLVFAVAAAAGGPGAAVDLIRPESLRLLPEGERPLDQAEIWLIPILGTIVAQEAISRTLGARTEATARRGALLGAGIYFAVGSAPIALGLIGPELGLELGAGDQFLPSVAEALLPPWLYIVFAGALLSAILSSVDSALLAVSASFGTAHARLRPAAPAAQRLAAARGATFAGGLVAAAIALSGEGLRELVLTASSVGGVLAAPLILALATRIGGPLAGAAAIAVQALVLACLDWWLGVPGAFLWTVLVGFAAYAVFAGLEAAGVTSARAPAPRR